MKAGIILTIVAGLHASNKRTIGGGQCGGGRPTTAFGCEVKMTLQKVTMKSSIDRDATTGRFARGHGGHGGRARFSRNRLGYSLLQALSEDFDEFGAAAVVKVREQDTTSYLRIIAGVLPAKIEQSVEISVFSDMNLQDPQEFLEAYRLAKSMIGAPPPMIEAEAVEVSPDEPEATEDE